MGRESWLSLHPIYRCCLLAGQQAFLEITVLANAINSLPRDSIPRGTDEPPFLTTCFQHR